MRKKLFYFIISALIISLLFLIKRMNDKRDDDFDVVQK